MKSVELNKKKKDRHVHEVEQTKANFLNDITSAKNSDKSIYCLTFDLEKTLETPSLNTNEAYYKRKLWTYNLCIYDEVPRKGYMYVWNESIASRGAQEIASCLKFHIENFVLETAEHIILYSDSCGAQNRNIKVTLMLKKILSNSNYLQKITQKFFVSGHSYNSCDRCFGLIERQKKITSEIFITNHWIQLISRAKKTEPVFSVQEMTSNMFYSTDNLQQMITNRKKSVDNSKVNWHQFREIENRQNEPFSLYVYQKQSIVAIKIDLSKRSITQDDFSNTNLNNLNNGYNLITVQKYNDLQNLLKYIPQQYHHFYNNLKFEHGSMDNDYNLVSEQESSSEESDIE